MRYFYLNTGSCFELIVWTALHAARIWHVNRPNVSFSEHSLRPVMLLVIESGAIYSATLLTLLILYEADSWFQYVLIDAVCTFFCVLLSKQTLIAHILGHSHCGMRFTQDVHWKQSQLTSHPFKQGLVFSMIIVRIGLGLTSVTGHEQTFDSISTRLRTRRTSDTATTWSLPGHHERGIPIGIPMETMTDPRGLHGSAKDETHVENFPVATYKVRGGEEEEEGGWPHVRPLG